MATDQRQRFRPATKEEFTAFVTGYPRQLERDLLRMIEPEQYQFNDFTLGDWPESVVAFYSAWGGDPDNIYAQVPGDWHILREDS